MYLQKYNYYSQSNLTHAVEVIVLSFFSSDMFYLISYTDSTSLYCDSEYLIVMAAGEVQLARPTPYCTLTGLSFMTCHLHKRKAAVIIHMFTCIKRSIHRGYRTSLHISLVPRLFINTTLDIYFNCVILLLALISPFWNLIFLFPFPFLI